MVLRMVGSMRPVSSLNRRTGIELDDMPLAAATAADTVFVGALAVGLVGALVIPFVACVWSALSPLFFLCVE